MVAATPTPEGPEAKEPVYSERLTLPPDEELRDGLDALARELQRSRTKKIERITVNTVIRSACRLVLEHAELREGDVANTEEEVLKLLLRRVRGRANSP